MRTVNNDRRHKGSRIHQSDPGLIQSIALLSTADASHGTSNLATMPRAGNYSRDTRAGRAGWSEPNSAPDALNTRNMERPTPKRVSRLGPRAGPGGASWPS